MSRAEYLAPDAQNRRDAAERKFEKLVAATIDASAEICKIEKESTPERRKTVITALESEGIGDPDLADRPETKNHKTNAQLRRLDHTKDLRGFVHAIPF
nr:hypothetical protein [Halalkaliarchaeum desulfuricum]